MRSRTGNKPSFRSSNLLNQRDPRVVFKKIDNDQFVKDNSIDPESFGFDPESTGLKSTQELPIDYSRFENHTFFNSARSKVDIAFDKIINYFPFDGQRADIQNFLNQLSGFEKHVFDSFPKNSGFLNFSGSAGSGGVYIEVRDGKSFNFPELNTSDFGVPVLDPNRSPFDLEMFIKIPTQVNDNQVILQRLSAGAGMTLGLSSSSDVASCDLVFLVASASDSYVVASGSIEKGSWVHISAQIQENNGSKQAAIYLNQSLFYTSSDTQDFDSLSFSGASIFVGSGSTHQILDYQFSPSETFSGSIDELRYFKNERSISDMQKYARQEVYPGSDNLSLYFKFNEPSGSYAGNNYVLDYSGNKLHSKIFNFKSDLRNTGSNASPVTFENIDYCPILFANHDDVSSLNEFFLSDAASFDDDNPNFILKLIPKNYLQQGAIAESLNPYDQNLGDAYSASSVPGTGFLPKPQLMIVFLLTYAKFYDELKLMIDYFSHVNYVELDDPESAIDKFLPAVAQYYGFKLPDLFSNTTSDQAFYGKSLEDDYGYAKNSLKEVRYQIWRRILGNITELIQSKGTRSSVRSAILSTGIIPENFFNIREFGGPAVVSLKNLRQQVQEKSLLADMSGSAGQAGMSPNAQGIFSNIPTLVSPFLSASRVEPGTPATAGTIVNGISNDPNDGLMTSGSFALETIIKFKTTAEHENDQSLIRLQATGSSTLLLGSQPCFLNVVYNHSDSTDTGVLHLLVRSSDEITAPSLDLEISDINMFNGEKWYVSAGRIRGDLINSISSSYYLRCGYAEDQTSYVYFTTSSYFKETTGDSSHDMFQNISSNYNASGTFVIIGSQSLDTASSLFLNNSIITHFDGLTGQIRFWSKDLNDVEALEHLRNYASRGVEDPRFNFNFDLETSGTFERLRLDVSADQATTGSDSSGNFRLFDFSQNNLHMSGTGFENNKLILKNELFQINRISPNIDLLQTDEKVRVRSLFNLTETDDISYPAPVFQLGPEQAVNDDNRFAVEFSAYKAMNEDIIGLIGDTQFLDNALGQTSSMFDEIYPDLEKVSKVYFERLTGPMDARRYLELFKWFDASLTVLIEQMLPRKTRFLGVNFVIESHLLERNRYRYPVDRMYLLDERPQRSTDLFLTALTAVLRRM